MSSTAAASQSSDTAVTDDNKYNTRSRDEDDETTSSFPLTRGSESLYYSNVDSDAFYHNNNNKHGDASVSSSTYYTQYTTRHNNNDGDATEIVHEMHLALLYLLSNPDEFKKVLTQNNSNRLSGAGTALTLDQWNAAGDIDEENNEEDESVMTSGTNVPLPYVVFADDSEVVLPQAHTASQLFGIEQVEGIELEAAAGIPALSQLFLRWLALMPGGDHLNIIDPPGLTVMRIAGGRYRVTAAHRVVWTWMNEFASLSVVGDPDSDPMSSAPSSSSGLEMGDLVTLTIVDVFETDSQGKLLSYCPTFDNRAVRKTSQATETIRKSSSKFFSLLGRAGKAVQQSEMNKKASKQLNKLAENMKHRVDEAVQQMNSPTKNNNAGSPTSSTAADPTLTNNPDPAPTDVNITDNNNESAKESAAAETEPSTSKPVEAATSSGPVLEMSETDTSRPSLYVSAASTEDEEGTQGASVLRV